MLLLFLGVFALLVSRCAAATQFTPAFQIALETALKAGGCTDCTAPVSCPTSLTKFSAGEIRCNTATPEEVIQLVIDPIAADGTATIADLTLLDTSSFLVGDTGLKFVVTGHGKLETLIVDKATSFDG